MAELDLGTGLVPRRLLFGPVKVHRFKFRRLCSVDIDRRAAYNYKNYYRQSNSNNNNLKCYDVMEILSVTTITTYKIINITWLRSPMGYNYTCN